ncbi:unnamed protein product [Peronospora belbahrii]|uniref:Reverse transcriptase Ty1/copia-type domain-containing protein n=1 Tax=Peronospora belbahrii TaxID=622444 RepID=A0ABN8DB04_9STRA|nr:unnamed protein product [Peronospora belbahrii]
MGCAGQTRQNLKREVKVEKEAQLEIRLQVLRMMDMSDGSLRDLDVANSGDVVLELRKSLYGLKQVGRLWSQILHERLTDAGFVRMTKTPIGDECYEVLTDEAELLGTTSTSGSPTIKAFQAFMGSLLWVARCTRPDVALSVNKATKQTPAPRLHG